MTDEYKKQKIKEIEIDGERIFISKSNLGYKVCYPIKKNINIPFYNKEEKKFNWDNINWKNLITGGSWTNVIMIIIFVSIILGAIKEYVYAVNIANECLIKNFTFVSWN